MPIYLGTTLIQGGAKKVEKKYVNFYDYDGTLLYSYTLDEAKSLSVLPNAPKHDTLEFESWNWTLEEVQNNNSPVNIGANYITKDRSTKLYVRVRDNSLTSTPLSKLYLRFTGVMTIDWGDGTVETFDSPTTQDFVHAYSYTGDAVISLSVEGGTISFLPNGNYASYRISPEDATYTPGCCPVKLIECGSNIWFGNNSFVNSTMEHIAMSNTVDMEWHGVNCQYLKAYVMPISQSTQAWKARLFDSSSRLEFLSFPKTMLDQDRRYSLTTNCLEDLMIPWGNNVGDGFTNASFPKTKRIICTRDCSSTYQIFTEGHWMALEDVYMLEQTQVPTMQKYGGYAYMSRAKIHIPSSMYSAFLANEDWAVFADNLIPEDV